jgi:predicted phosphodiesterase
MKNLDNKFIAHRAVTLEKLMVRRVGSRFHKALGGRLNKKIKRALKKELTEKDIYICGHTHYAEMDRPQKFVNSGIVDYGLGQYLILNNDHIISKEEWYA